MRQVLLTLIVMGSAFAFLGATASGQEPRRLAEQIVELNHLERSMKQSAGAFLKGYKEVIGGSLKQKDSDLSDEQLAELYQIMDEEVTSGINELTGPMTTMLVDFYVGNFSEDELSTLVEMHSSPVYQKQISLTPGFMQEAAKLQAEWQLSAQGRLSKRVEEWVKKYSEKKAE